MSDTGPNPTILQEGSSPTPQQIAASQQAAGFTGQPVPMQQPTPPAGYITEDELNRRLEAARSQEREKLYPQLQAVDEMRTQLTSLQEERDAEKAERQRILDEQEAERKRQEEAAMSATALNTRRLEELTERLNTAEQQRDQERAMFEKERQFQALEEYKRGTVTAINNDPNMQMIMPEFVDLITGNNEEEINASIRSMQERSANVQQQLQQYMMQQRQGMAGTMPTQPSMGPMEDQQSQRPITQGDVAGMSMDDWRKHRGQLLPASGVAYRQQTGR